MIKKQRKLLAKQIAEIEQDNNILEVEKIERMDKIISSCSLVDLLEIDDLIQKYLTN